MTSNPLSTSQLEGDLKALGVRPGDGLFVHASIGAIGPVSGGANAVIAALQSAVGDTGLLAMPGFSSDAYFPDHIDRAALSPGMLKEIEDAVPGFDPETSPTADMGIIAETFRTWPGTCRSTHPTTSICLNGPDALQHVGQHDLAWATGPQTPLGTLRGRKHMKMLLIGVGWSRCSALHTAETLADTRRTKIRRFKSGKGDAAWMETCDVADDMNRLFPDVGAALEATGCVTGGHFGAAASKLCDYAPMVSFATNWINAANIQSGDRL